MTVQQFRTLSPDLRPDAPETFRNIAEIVRQAMQGKMNVVTTLTLTTSVSTTVFRDPRIGVHSYLGFQPLTANAAADIASLYTTSQSSGVATVNHSVSSNADRIWRVVIIA
jgi:hypothetical protein